MLIHSNILESPLTPKCYGPHTLTIKSERHSVLTNGLQKLGRQILGTNPKSDQMGLHSYCQATNNLWLYSLDLSTQKETFKKILNSLQRLALKMINSSIHSTPTAGMDILTGILPLNDHIRMTATNCSVRLARIGHSGH